MPGLSELRLVQTQSSSVRPLCAISASNRVVLCGSSTLPARPDRAGIGLDVPGSQPKTLLLTGPVELPQIIGTPIFSWELVLMPHLPRKGSQVGSILGLSFQM